MCQIRPSNLGPERFDIQTMYFVNLIPDNFTHLYDKVEPIFHVVVLSSVGVLLLEVDEELLGEAGAA